MSSAQGGSRLLPLGILLMLLGVFAPTALVRIATMTGMAQQTWPFALLLDGFRLGFFVGLAMLIIGALRDRRRDSARKTMREQPPFQ